MIDRGRVCPADPDQFFGRVRIPEALGSDAAAASTPATG